MKLAFGGKAILVALVLSALFVSLLMPTPALADELYAKVRGIVTDTSGAVIPSVTVKISNTATGLTKETISGTDGTFELLSLPPGTYTITATKSNFATTTIPNVPLGANQVFVAPVSMKVGAVTEELTITANAVQVEQTSMQLGATITESDLLHMPVLNRNWINLQLTLPGVYQADRFGNNYSTNGSQSQQNSYLVNGTDSNDLPINTPLVLPSPDSISEVHMVTNTINPEYGRNSGAVMNAISKSGTNSFHGTLFESYRDTGLNVRNFFQLNPTVFHQHIYGGTIGGPVIKNKTFLFFSLQNTRNRRLSTNNVDQGTAGLTSVFDPATLAYGGSGNVPLSAFSFPDGVSSNVTPFAVAGFPAGTPWATVFAGGTIPSSAYNPLSLNLVSQFVPQPNFTSNQFSFNPTRSLAGNQFLGRFDQNIGSHDQVWFYGFGENDTANDAMSFFGGTVPGFNQLSVNNIKQFTAAWSHTISSNILNEFRAGFTRNNFKAVFPAAVTQPSDAGFPDINPQFPSLASVPLVSVNGYFSLGFSTNGPQPRWDNTYQITDNFSWVKGHHSLKFGYEGRKWQVFNPFAGSNNGHFTFDPSGTYSTGDAGLDFLLGIPATYAQGTGAVIKARTYEHYFYFQDQWKVKPNLTVTIGTGYQIDPPIQELQDDGLARVCYVAGQQSGVFPTAPVGLNYPGDPGCNNAGGAKTHYTHFGPRFGFAWSPSGRFSGGPGKTSLRGGIGIYYNRSEEEANLQDLSNPPFGTQTPGATAVGGSPAWPNPFADIAGGPGIANPFPFTAPAPGSPVDFSQFAPLGFNIGAMTPPNRTIPYAMNFNLTFQRELPAQTILSIGYVGAQARKLVVSKGLQAATPEGIAACLATPACAGNPSLAPYTLPDMYPLDPTLWGIPGFQYNGGESNYNSLQITVDKRTTHGLSFLATYAYAHSLDTSSSFEDISFLAAGNVDAYGNLGRDYGDSAFDVRHRGVMSFSYELPDLSKVVHGLPSRVFGGWRFNGINSLQTGYPIQFQDTRNRSLACSNFVSYYGCPDRPDVVMLPTPTDPHSATFNNKVTYFFNPADFANNALGTEGNAGRGILHGPGFWNFDASLQKETKITERMSLTLGASAFNFFNHTNFGQPSGSFSSANFGRVTGIASNSNSRIVQLDARFRF